MKHYLTRHEDGSIEYMGVVFEEHKNRYMIRSNIDLLNLGLCTPKTLHRGHKGYKSLATLMNRIDKGLGD